MLKNGSFFIAIAAFVAFAASTASGQTTFELEGNIGNPARVPTDVIAILKSDERVDACFKTEGAGTDEQAWFEAAELDLDNDRRADLIIKPKHPCMYGANQGPFWIFRNLPDGYQKIFSESGLKLTVLPQRANSFNTIRISRVVGMKGHDMQFRFSQGKYRPAK